MKKNDLLIYPLNRVEGDVQIHAQVENGIVSEARSVGTMPLRQYDRRLADANLVLAGRVHISEHSKGADRRIRANISCKPARPTLPDRRDPQYA